jgi:hypothetical protein
MANIIQYRGNTARIKNKEHNARAMKNPAMALFEKYFGKYGNICVNH